VLDAVATLSHGRRRRPRRQDRIRDPKRRDDAREQGQVAMSTDAIAAAGARRSAIVLVVGGGMLATSTGAACACAASDVGALGREEFTENDWASLVTQSVKALGVPAMTIILPLLAVVVLAALRAVGSEDHAQGDRLESGTLNPMQGGAACSARAVPCAPLLGLREDHDRHVRDVLGGLERRAARSRLWPAPISGRRWPRSGRCSRTARSRR
jgi:hypothetical protein